jgi:hypothetical protein
VQTRDLFSRYSETSVSSENVSIFYEAQGKRKRKRMGAGVGAGSAIKTYQAMEHRWIGRDGMWCSRYGKVARCLTGEHSTSRSKAEKRDAAIT